MGKSIRVAARAQARNVSRLDRYDAIAIVERRARLGVRGLAPWRVARLLGLDGITRSSLDATPTDTVRLVTANENVRRKEPSYGR